MRGKVQTQKNTTGMWHLSDPGLDKDQMSGVCQNFPGLVSPCVINHPQERVCFQGHWAYIAVP